MRKCPELKKQEALRKEYTVKRSLWKRLLGYCPCCERYFRYPVKTERRNTAYVKESNNWLTACRECQEEDYAYYAELWADYYNSIY